MVNQLPQQYNKLVRDKIVSIIQNNNEEAVFKVLSGPEFTSALQEKLTEELQEYLQSKNPEELADLLEIIEALASHHDLTTQEPHELKRQKRHQRGGFEKGHFLKETRPKQN